MTWYPIVSKELIGDIDAWRQEVNTRISAGDSSVNDTYRWVRPSEDEDDHVFRELDTSHKIFVQKVVGLQRQIEQKEIVEIAWAERRAEAEKNLMDVDNALRREVRVRTRACVRACVCVLAWAQIASLRLACTSPRTTGEQSTGEGWLCSICDRRCRGETAQFGANVLG